MDLHRIKESECEMCGVAAAFPKRLAQTRKNVCDDGCLIIFVMLQVRETTNGCLPNIDALI